MLILAADAWTKASAVGTLAAALASVFLGGVTVWLVLTTRGIVTATRDEFAATNRLAEATQDLAKQGALALALQVEPRMVPVHEAAPHFDPSEDVGGSWSQHYVNPLLIEIENAGAGVAELTSAEVTVSGWSKPDMIFPGVVRSGARAVLRAEYTTPPPGTAWNEPPSVPPGADVIVRVNYRGAGGREYHVHFGWSRPTGSEARWRLTLIHEAGHTALSAMRP